MLLLNDVCIVCQAFFNAIKEIIKMTAHQEQYGLANVALLMEGSPDTIPKVRANNRIVRWTTDIVLF